MSRTIDESRSLNDPQRSYKWRVILPSLGIPSPNSILDRASLGTIDNRIIQNPTVSTGSTVIDGTIRRTINPTTFNPSFQVKEVNITPLAGVDRDPFYEAGRNTYFPGLEDIDTFSITFYQDASNNIPNYIRDWKRKIVNQDGTKNLPSEYWKSIIVQLLDGQNRPTLHLECQQCYPLGTSGYSLTGASENLDFIQEFSVNRIIFKDEEVTSARDNNLSNLSRRTSEELIRNASFINKVRL